LAVPCVGLRANRETPTDEDEMSNSVTWTYHGSGAWSTAAYWSNDAVPGATDDVTLTSAARHGILFNETDSVAGLVSGNDLLELQSGELTVTGDTDLAGGLLQTGGTLSLGGSANSIAGGITVSTGDIDIGSGDGLYMHGSGTFGATNSALGATIQGAATLTTAGIFTIAQNGGLTELTLGGGLVWKNTGTVVDAGIVTPDSLGTAFTIVNQAQAVFDFTTDIACLMNAYMNGQTATSNFNNAGLIEKTGGTGATTFYSTINSTGKIDVAVGTINIEDGGLIGGTIEGGSTLQLNGGGTLRNALDLGTTIYVSGGTVVLTGLRQSGDLIVGATADQTGSVTIGSATETGSLIVEGDYNIEYGSGMAMGTAGGDVVITAGGTLAKSVGVNGANIAPAVTDDGRIVVDQGSLRLSRELSGTGAVTIGNDATFEAGSSVTGGIIVTLGSGSDLILDAPGSFKGEIGNFVAGGTLDLRGLTVTHATASSGGTLTLQDGSKTVGTLLLTNNDSGAVFTYGTDGHGGTLLEISAAASASPAMSFIAGPTLAMTLSAETALHHAGDAAGYLDLTEFNPAVTRTIATANGVIDLSGTQTAALFGHHGHTALLPHSF
jgi:hypothetical protein